MRYFYALLCSFTITSCSKLPELTKSPNLQVTSTHILTKPYIEEIQENGLFHLSCTDKYPNGVSAYAAFDKDTNTRSRAQLAKLHFAHAAMASNSYRDPLEKPTFVIPGWMVIESYESKESGFAFETYGNQTDLVSSDELVIAFRGTNFKSLADWKTNLSLMTPAQFRQAYNYISNLKSTYPKKKMTVVGHSLGGAIAINMALSFENLNAVGFNPSPRFNYGETKISSNEITVIYEVGEVLDGLFGSWARFKLPKDTFYGNYNFLDYRVWTFSPVQEHGIYEITRALTVVAMTRNEENAKAFFKANIPVDIAKKTDWPNCQYLYN